MKKGSKRVERPGLSSEEVDEIKQAFEQYKFVYQFAKYLLDNYNKKDK